MRVAIVVPGFSASESDWCIPALLTLVRRLTPRIDVEIFTLRYPPRAGTYEIAGARVHALGGGTVRRWGKVGLLGSAFVRVIRAHRARPFDVVHGLWADEAGAVAVAAARWIARPAVVSVMGGELVRLAELSYGSQQSLAGRLLVGLALRHATFVTVGSSTLARAIPRNGAGRLRIVPLGVDTARFRPAVASGPALAGRFKILHVASLSPVKDQATLIAAMADVARAEHAHLHVVGDGPLRGQLEAHVAASGLDGQVTFHGAISHDRLPAFYQAADVCVVSSRHESQSMVALEACACGRPVVGTAVGLLPDLEAAARVVAPGDAAALARVLVDVARDHAMRLAMGRTARAIVERHLTVEQTVDAWLDLYGAAVRARAHALPRAGRPGE